MTNLIMAGVRRYLKFPVWWCCVAAALILGIFFGNIAYKDQSLDVSYIIFMQILYAVLISLSIGREWEDGGLRNKVINGYGKVTVFLSELILAVCASLLLTFLSLMTFALLCGGFFPASQFNVGMSCLLNLLLLGIASAVIDVTLCMLVSSRSIAAVLALLLILGMVLAVDQLNAKLNQPEKHVEITTLYNEETGHWERQRIYTPNPDYVSGTQRACYQFWVRLIPIGQADEHIEILNVCARLDQIEKNLQKADTAVLSLGIFYSIGLTAALTAVGSAAFRRKELK